MVAKWRIGIWKKNRFPLNGGPEGWDFLEPLNTIDGFLFILHDHVTAFLYEQSIFFSSKKRYSKDKYFAPK